MGFVLAPVEAIRVVVEIEVPGDYGRTEKADLDVKYKKLPVSELEELGKGEGAKRSMRDVVRENILDIQGIKTPEGQDIPYSESVRDDLLNMTYVLNPLIASFWRAQNGQKQEAEKN